MKVYFSKFISGVEEVVEDFLIKQKIEILHIEDGVVIYKSSKNLNDVNQIDFFNSNLILLYSFKNLKPNIKNLTKIALSVSSKTSFLKKIKLNISSKREGFKVISILENNPKQIDLRTLSKIENKILKLKTLYLDIKKAKIELWIIIRRSGMGLVGLKKITKPKLKIKREKGTIRYELAAILSVLSEPKKNDVILDPFAGSGVIPIHRASFFPFEKIIAAEGNEIDIKNLKQKVRKSRKRIDVQLSNALDMKLLKDRSVSTIITDPPWGEFKKNTKISEFYKKMLFEFYRVLKQKGKIVLLLSASIEFEKIIKKDFQDKLKILKIYNILVSGKKAVIYKITKT